MDDIVEATPNSKKIVCSTCKREYKSKSGLAKHAKSCTDSQGRACKYCDRVFDSYPGLRAHEIRAHKSQENIALGAAKTETEILQRMANLEAQVSAGNSIFKVLMEATGLSRDKIRHRRDKSIYKQYMELAVRQYPNRTTTPGSRPVDERSSSVPTAPKPSISRARAQVTPRGNIPATEPAPLRRPHPEQNFEPIVNRSVKTPIRPRGPIGRLANELSHELPTTPQPSTSRARIQRTPRGVILAAKPTP